MVLRLYHVEEESGRSRGMLVAAMTCLVLSFCILAASRGAASISPSVPIVGDWDLNLRRTHYGPSVEKRKRERFICKENAAHVECVIRSVRPDGRQVIGTFRAALDGALSPVVGIAGVDEVRLQRGTPGVVGATFSLRGAPVFAYRAYRSDDGKSLMIVSVEPSTGKALTTVVVYDRH